jgi:Zn finger protein HypA/HybF involved in hydrogenase expression
MKDVMVIRRPYRDEDGKVMEEVIFRCLKCGNDMVEEEFEVVCEKCGSRVGCCDGEG